MEIALDVGDKILFDHLGGKDRPGEVVKITATKVHIKWTAPSSGITRVVPIPRTIAGVRGKNVRVTARG